MTIQNVANIVLLLVKLAEYLITGTKMGAERKEKVISWFYTLLPEKVQKSVTREQLDNLIEDGVTLMKKELESAAG